jgi:hypothetical protein
VKGQSQMACILSISLLPALFAALGCSSQAGTGESADAGGSTINQNNENNPVQNGSDASAPKKAIGFAPSNLTGVSANQTSDNQIAISCTFDTEQGDVDCLDNTEYSFQIVTQNDPDKTEVGVFVVGSLTIGQDAVVSVVGTRPIAIVAAGDILIKGTLQAAARLFANAHGGGFSSPPSSSADHTGKGPGGGGTPTGTSGGGGGAYCGKGGGINGGQPYGNPQISPLRGGSSGALGYGSSGAGGGAIQLVSGASITLTSLAKIHTGGAGGEWGGNGGGSGGAILLEAPTVTMAGTLASNGGGGGADANDAAASGYDATPNGTPASGGVGSSLPPVNTGGSGSAGTAIDGSAGQYTGPSLGLGNYGGGGGGGAGRIRINTTSGQATITGVLSPAASTPCFSQGKLTSS